MLLQIKNRELRWICYVLQMPIKLRMQNFAWRWTKGQAGQNQMTEASDGGTGRDEFLYWVTHMPTKTRGKIKLLGTLCSRRLG